FRSSFAPLPGSSVVFETGVKAKVFIADVKSLKIEPVGEGESGFARYRILLRSTIRAGCGRSWPHPRAEDDLAIAREEQSDRSARSRASSPRVHGPRGWSMSGCCR
ncbi:hypothetical protein EN788_42960, partial [Mesorhizobium sp. M2D.F.Ca.ET.145.01.1.1]